MQSAGRHIGRQTDRQVYRTLRLEEITRFKELKDIGQLKRIGTDEDEFVREKTVRTIGEFNDPATLNFLIEKLEKDLSGDVRLAALEVLESFQNPRSSRIITVLIERLKNDPRLDIRDKSAAMLGKIGDVQIVYDALSHASVTDSASTVRQTSERTLAKLLSPLIEELNSNDISVKKLVILKLGQMVAKAAVDRLIELLLNDKNNGVRGIAAWALGAIADTKAYDALSTSSQSDSDENVRKNATASLSIIRKSMGL